MVYSSQSPMVCSSYKEGSGHTSFPNTCFLTFQKYRSTARFTSCSHPTFWDSTWNIIITPTYDLCDADDIQDEQHVIFHCVNPHVISLRRKYAPLFPQTGAHNVITF